MPFSIPYLQALMEKLRCKSPVRDIFVTELIDEKPESGIFTTKPVYTKIKVKDFEPTQFVRFFAEVTYPETGGALQKEVMGVTMDSWGRAIYSIKLVEIGGNREYLSFDSLARVIADLIVDTTRLSSPLLTASQRHMLEVLYGENYTIRDKFVILTAQDIFISKEINDDLILSELEQLIGFVDEIKIDKTEYISGTHGLICLTKNCECDERTLSILGFVMALSKSLRLFQIKQHHTSSKILRLTHDITERKFEKLADLRADISTLNTEIAMYPSLLSHMELSLKKIETSLDELPSTPLVAMIKSQLNFIKAQMDGVKNTLQSLMTAMNGLENLAMTLLENEQTKIYEQTKHHTKKSAAIGEALEIVEAGIIGVYILEAVHLFFIFSGREEELVHSQESWLLGFPIPFWILLILTPLGIFLAWKIMQWRKRKAVEEE